MEAQKIVQQSTIITEVTMKHVLVHSSY